MRKISKISVVLLISTILLLGTAVQAFANESPDWLSKDTDYKKLSAKMTKKLPGGIPEDVDEDMIRKNIKSIKSDVEGKYGLFLGAKTKLSEEDNQKVGSIKILYKDMDGNVLDSKFKVGLKLGTYDEDAIRIDGFKLVGKISQSIELTDSNYNGVIVFKYQRVKAPGEPEQEKPEPEKPQPVDENDKTEVNDNEEEPVVVASAVDLDKDNDIGKIKDDDQEKEPSPKTGDSIPVYPFAGLALGIAGIVFLLLTRKRLNA